MAEIEKKTKKVAPKATKEPAKKVAKAAKVEEKPTKAVSAKKAEKVEETKPAKPTPTEALCFVKDVRVTPRKARYVADFVRGMSVKEALAILSRVNKSACLPLAKAIKSAASNATNNFGMDEETLYVAEIQCSDGARMKRFTPRAKGSASPVIKRMCNIRVVVKERK